MQTVLSALREEQKKAVWLIQWEIIENKDFIADLYRILIFGFSFLLKKEVTEGLT